MARLRDNIEVYVQSVLNNYKPQPVRAPKVIHDTILGSNLFYPHEIAVLDLPLMQRLRRVSQVAVASLVFPSGNHNRFEHTLGVAVIADKLITALYRKIKEGKEQDKAPYNKIDVNLEFLINHVRMAAILHDCGHSPFSHVSEKYFKNLDDLKVEKESNKKLSGASAHEILSYLIVTSKTFKDFFAGEIEAKYKIRIDLELVGEMIVGYVNDPLKAFLVEVINGAFDADKLDYIQRDSHFTGIKMVLDLPRLFHTIDIIEDDRGKLRLSIDLSGVATLEQIVFNKMMLFSTVYHHQKVRASECLFRSIFEESHKNKQKINGFTFESAADFLYLTDDDIYGLAKQNIGLVSKIACELSYRQLPKRSLVLSVKTIEAGVENLARVMSFCQDPECVYQLREAISEETENLGTPVGVEDIWLDMPNGPSFKEGIEWPIKSIGEETGYIKFRGVLPVDDWVRAFSENKWKGYIFTRPEYRNVVYEASENVIDETFGIKLNKFAKLLCKIN